MRVSVRLPILLLVASSACAQQPPIQITADLSEAPRKFFHAEIDLPVRPGPLALTTAQWIPGHHAPKTGVNDITGIVFTANGSVLPWRRDDVDLYQYHLTVPPGVSSLHAHLDYIATIKSTNVLAMLEWEDLMLYPAGIAVRNIPIQPSVIVPAGWGIATSLKPLAAARDQTSQSAGGAFHYAATSVETLEDSPVMTGLYFHEYALNPGAPHPVFFDVTGDSAEDVVVRPSVLADLTHLVGEATAMYSSTHYDTYHFLLTLTKDGPYGGLEHHESSDNSLPPMSLTTDNFLAIAGPVLSHEFTHSWNGKYRRPAGLATPDFATPMRGELLWVYEGLTNYLGNILGARCGFISPDLYRQYLAITAARLDQTPGRQWRSTADTAVAISGLQGGSAWGSWRRSADYYSEGDLVWLDVDTTIRRLTGDAKNLHHFLEIFLAGHGSTPPEIVPYGFDELVSDLKKVVPNDWAGFLRTRIYQVQPRANLEGIEQGGYKLAYTDKPSAYESISAFGSGSSAAPNVWYSLGLSLDGTGNISDVRLGGPADKARFAPGEKILGVDGQVYSSGALLAALSRSKTATAPIQFIVQNDTELVTLPVDFHDGPRYPALIRAEGTADLLDEILKPLTPAP